MQQVIDSHVAEPFLMRERVNKKLEAALSCPLTIVTAPAGYGKTVAVSLYLVAAQKKYLWVMMSESIKTATNDYFWYLLTNKLRERSKEIAETLEQRGFPHDSIQIGRLLDYLRNLQIESDFYLILDNYQHVENKEINHLVKQITMARLPWLHLVLLSRPIPTFNVLELKLKGFCETLDAQTLSFTEEESAQYFDLINFQADEQIKQFICQHADGWITALYLMTLNYAQDEQLNMPSSVYSMIKAIFFDNQPSNIQELLLHISLFGELAPEQVTYMFDDKQALQSLNALCDHNNMIIRDRKGNYYLHQLFQDFLLKERMLCNIDSTHIISRAGDWYAEHGNSSLACKYRVMIHEYDKIFEDMEKMDITGIISLDQQILVQAFDKVAPQVKYLYPMATLKYIFLNVIFRDVQKAKRLLDDLKSYYLTHEHPYYSRERILGEINIILTAILFNNAQAIAECADEAYQLLFPEHSMIRTRRSVLTYGSPHFSYSYYNQPGHYHQVVRTLQTGYEKHILVTNGCGMGCGDISQAEYALETGCFDQVESSARKAIYKAESFSQICIIACAYLSLARLYIYQNRKKDLDELLLKLSEMRQVENNAINLNVLDNCVGYIYSCLQSYSDIPQWLRSVNVQTGSQYQGIAVGFDQIIKGRSVLLMENYLQLEALTESFVYEFGVYDVQLGFIHNYIHNAIAKYHLYGLSMGVATLQNALDIAAQDDIIMPFMENSSQLLPMLESSLLNTLNHEAYFIRLLAGCHDYHKNRQSIIGKDNQLLSAREQEILQLVANGYSQKHIAAQFCISPNTVKRHIQNIYRKLDVQNKTMAINKYKALREDRRF